MKDDLKFSPIDDALWVVSSGNGSGNNGTNGKVTKSGTCFQYWGGGLEFERKVWGEDLRFVLGVLEFRGGGLS